MFAAWSALQEHVCTEGQCIRPPAGELKLYIEHLYGFSRTQKRNNALQIYIEYSFILFQMHDTAGMLVSCEPGRMKHHKPKLGCRPLLRLC